MNHKVDQTQHRRTARTEIEAEVADRQPWASHSGQQPFVELVQAFARAHRLLQAFIEHVQPNDTLLLATDQQGFPIAQKILTAPRELPCAVVIGRHNRCGLSIPDDQEVSLRHLLLTIWPGQGSARLRGYDLGGHAGLVLADGQRVPGFSAFGHVALTFGSTALFVLPGGEQGQAILEGTMEQAFQRLTGIDSRGGGFRLAVSATAEPSVAEIGGYRPIDVESRPQPRGVLQLRSLRIASESTDENVRELEINSEQLRRGLLIGRYSDRCSLAGSGRNLSRVHALVTEETPGALLVYDLASTNGVRPSFDAEGVNYPVVRLTPTEPVLLGHFELSWIRRPGFEIH